MPGIHNLCLAIVDTDADTQSARGIDIIGRQDTERKFLFACLTEVDIVFKCRSIAFGTALCRLRLRSGLPLCRCGGIIRGCRPFSAEYGPPDRFPGAPNPLSGEIGVLHAGAITP